MDWSPVKQVLAKVAPVVGTALGGPLGGAAGAVIASALGIDAEQAKDPAAVSAAIAGATPDQLLALRKADQDFQARMAELGFKNTADLEQIAASDRANARQREAAIRDHTPQLLALVVTAGFFGLLAFMCVRELPLGSKDLLNIMLGSLGTAWVSIIAYYFGSSAGSAHKTELLAKSPPIH